MIEGEDIKFQLPVLLNMELYDDTELVEAAHNHLHAAFSALAEQTRQWKLSEDDLRKLSERSKRRKSAKPEDPRNDIG